MNINENKRIFFYIWNIYYYRSRPLDNVIDSPYALKLILGLKNSNIKYVW